MKFEHYDYHVVKCVNQEIGMTFYMLTTPDIKCRALVDDGKVGLIDFEIKKKFIKGWVIDEDYCPYEYLMDICRERSDKVIDAIKEADKVADDLKIFRRYLEENKQLEIDELKPFGPSKKRGNSK